ncbi:hypothetical protein NL676_001413 [Syzygium grande]|nr:hypothetical protein NL676_001413 [Syzygium grande]
MFSGVMNLFGFEDVILDCVIIGWLRVATGGGGGNATVVVDQRMRKMGPMSAVHWRSNYYVGSKQRVGNSCRSLRLDRR